MERKSVLHAAVGAPVVAYRKVGERVTTVKDKVGTQKTEYGKNAEKALENWAVEGEKVMVRISEGKVVEEISSKVDLDQAKEQVGKLRDQIEDMLATWRTSFRPEKTEEIVVEDAEEVVMADKAPAKKATATKAPATKASATKASATKASATKASAAKTTKSSTEAKTSSTKTASEKKDS